MKLACKVIKAEAAGERLYVTLEGQCFKENPELRQPDEQRVVVPNNLHTRQAYYVGRSVSISVNPTQGRA